MNLTGRPIYQKGQATPKKTPKRMRRVAKGKKASSDCPIMESAKDEQCFADWCGCNGSTETTAMRHIRKFKIGGTGMKPPNYIGFYGCQRSEDMFAISTKQEWTWKGLCEALILTQMKLRAKGLLPP